MQIDISRDDVLEFIDKDSIKESINWEIQQEIKRQALRVLKEEDTLQFIIREMIEKLRKEDAVFAEEIKKELKGKLLKTIKTMSDFDFKYHGKVAEIIVDITKANKSQIEQTLTSKMFEFIKEIGIDQYHIDYITKKILEDYIMESTEGKDLRDSVKTFVSCGLDRMMDRLAE
jgi:hypothetical protein